MIYLIIISILVVWCIMNYAVSYRSYYYSSAHRTRYRVITHGMGDTYLQYNNGFWLGGWRYVPEPYYDWIIGRGCSDYKKYVYGSNGDFFKKHYPNILMYFEERYYPEQQELEKHGLARKREYDDNKYKIGEEL